MGIPLDNYPTTWPELLDPSGTHGARAKSMVERLIPVREPITGGAVSDLALMNDTFGSVLVLLGPEEARALIAPLLKLTTAMLETQRRHAQIFSGRELVWQLSLFNAVECCGALHGLLETSSLRARLEELIKGLRRMDDEEAYRCALLSVAAGEPKLAARFSRGGKLPARLTPGETFGFNVQGFVRYLATAQERSVPADQVYPAWVEFVRAFPFKKEAETLDWSDLLCAARVFYHTLSKRPVEEVGAALHELVRSLR